jgi:hypothetical protein
MNSKKIFSLKNETHYNQFSKENQKELLKCFNSIDISIRKIEETDLEFIQFQDYALKDK